MARRPQEPEQEKSRLARLWEQVKETQLYRSIYRNDYPLTRRDRVLVVLNNVFLHLHPNRLARYALNMRFTWCAGGLAFFLFLILTVSGVYLMFYYIPSVEMAYQSIQELEADVAFGSLFRNFHRWAAHAMVIMVLIHMFRVFYTGSYKPPREFNWVIGVVLFVLTLFMSFSGYLLPWDQLAFWAFMVGMQMAAATPVIGDQVAFALIGGHNLGQYTLIRWYTLHVLGIPLVAFALMLLHFWRIRKDGFSANL